MLRWTAGGGPPFEILKSNGHQWKGKHFSNLNDKTQAISWWCPWPGGRPEERPSNSSPDSKVYGASMGPIWGRQDPGGPHVGPAAWITSCELNYKMRDEIVLHGSLIPQILHLKTNLIFWNFYHLAHFFPVLHLDVRRLRNSVQCLNTRILTKRTRLKG